MKVDEKSVGAVDSYTFTDVNANHTISATFARDSSGDGGGHDSDPYLRFDSNGGTRFDPIDEDGRSFSLNVYDDEEYGAHIPTRPGYRFTGWYKDSRLTIRVDEDETLRVTSSVTLFAGWTETSVPGMLNGDDHYAYIQGYSDGSVRPNANITRAHGWPATSSSALLDENVRDDNLTTSNAFPDVNEDYWANTAISTMARLGVINAATPALFDPDANITRAEFAADLRPVRRQRRRRRSPPLGTPPTTGRRTRSAAPRRWAGSRDTATTPSGPTSTSPAPRR